MTSSRKWDAISTNNETHMNIGGLINIAKKYNFEGYTEWKKKNNGYYITLEEIQDPYKVCQIITDELSQKLKLYKESWYMLVGNFWKQQKTPDLYVIEEIRKYIGFTQEQIAIKINCCTDDETREDLIKYQKKFLDSYKDTQRPSYLSTIIKYLKTTLVDDNFGDKLDFNVGKLAFKNGIMDLKTKRFTEGIKWSDYLTTTIDYEYKESTTDYIKNILKKILNNNEEHLNYFLSLIGYSLTGDASNQKSLYFMIDKLNGKGDNGKSFFFEILDKLMPNYVYNSSSSFLELKNTKSHKQLAMMKGKRLVWIDEQAKNKLNANLIKQIANGKNIENEVMHGTSEKIDILFKLFIISNHIPNIESDESAVYNRYKQISFSSHFDRTGDRKEENIDKLEFIADITLADKILKEHYNEVFQLIIDYAHEFYKNGIVEEPKEFKQDKEEVKEKNDPFIEWFEDNIIKDENDKLFIDDIVEKLNSKRDIVRSSMERLGFKYDKDLSFGICKVTKKKRRGGFIGVRFLNENELGDGVETITHF
jgi:putative DNA primase/helicase